MGNKRADGTGVHGRLYELAVFAGSSRMTTGERDLIERALAAKWDIEALPGQTYVGNGDVDAQTFSGDIGGTGRAGTVELNAGSVGGMRMRIDARGTSSDYLLLIGHEDGVVLDGADAPKRGRYPNRAWFAQSSDPPPSGNVRLTFDLAVLGIDQASLAQAGWGLSVADVLANLPSSVAEATDDSDFYPFTGYVTDASSAVEFIVPVSAMHDKVFTLYQPPTVSMSFPRSITEPRTDCDTFGIQAFIAPAVSEAVSVLMTFSTLSSTASADDIGGAEGGSEPFIEIVIGAGGTSEDYLNFCVQSDAIYESRERILWDVSVTAVDSNLQVLLQNEAGVVMAAQTTAQFSMFLTDSLLPPVIALTSRPFIVGGDIPTELVEGERFLLSIEVINRADVGMPNPQALSLSFDLVVEVLVTDATVPYCLNTNGSCNSARSSDVFRQPEQTAATTTTIMSGSSFVEMPLRVGGDRIAGSSGRITVRIGELTGDAIDQAAGSAPTTEEIVREFQVTVRDDDLATLDVFFLDVDLQVAWSAQQRAMGTVNVMPLALDEKNTEPVSILVQLSNRPQSSSPVVVQYAHQTDMGRGMIEVSGPSQMTFTQGNWNRAQAIMFNVVDDVFPGDSEVSLTLEVNVGATTEEVYRATASSATILFHIAGDETAELLVSANPVPVEEGSSSTFSVRLAARPLGSVVYVIDPDGPDVGIDWRPGEFFNLFDPEGGRVTADSQRPFIFSSSNWDSSQTFTVESLLDDDISGNTRSADSSGTFGFVLSPLTIASPGLDSAFASSQVVVFESVDNDVPRIVVTPDSRSLNETGAGSSATFMVRLGSVPRGLMATDTFVEVDSVAYRDDLLVTPSPTRLRFVAMNDNWRQPQPVTVTAVDDAVAEKAEIGIEFFISVDTQSDYRRPNVGPTRVTVSVTDDEVAGLIASTYDTTVAEGATATVDVSLAAALSPASVVQVSVMSSSESIVLVTPSTLRFTASDFNVTQTVTMTSIDDAFIEEHMAMIVLEGVSTDTRSPYTEVSATISVAVIDDESAEVAVISDNLTMSVDGVLGLDLVEGTTSALSFTLGAFPQSTVTLSLGAAANYLRFSMPDDASPVLRETIDVTLFDLSTRTVSVSVVNDALFAGERNSAISVRVSAPGTFFAALMVDDIPVRVKDDEEVEVSLCLSGAEPPPGAEPPSGACASVGQLAEDTSAEAAVIVKLSTDRLVDGVRIPVTFAVSATAGVPEPAGCQAPGERDDCDYYLSTAMIALSASNPMRRLPLQLVNDEIYESGDYESSEAFLLSFVTGNGALVDPQASSLDVTIAESRERPKANLRVVDSEGDFTIPDVGLGSGVVLELELERPTFRTVTATILVTPSIALPFAPAALDLTLAEYEENGERDYAIEGLMASTGNDPSVRSVLMTVESGETLAVLAVTARGDEDVDNEGLIFSVSELSGDGVAVALGASTAGLVIVENLALPTLPDDTRVEILDIDETSARIRWHAVAGNRDKASYRVLLYPERVDLPGDDLRVAEALMSVSSATINAVLDDTTDTMVRGLLPNHRYFVLVAALNPLRRGVFYRLEDSALTPFVTLAALDEDGDGLADNLRAADAVATDTDGDGISDDVVAYLDERYASLGQTTLMVSKVSDANANGVPDVLEVARGLPVDMASAQDALGVQRVALSLEPVISVASVGFYTSVSVARHVQLTDDDPPASLAYAEVLCTDPEPAGLARPLSAWFRRGDCENALPAKFECACDRPESDAGGLLLRPDAHDVWWVAVDSDGNWPLGGGVRQTIQVLPQIHFQPTPLIPISRPFSLLAILNGPLPDGDRGLDVQFTAVQDLGGFVDVVLENLPVVAFQPDANARQGRSVGFLRAAGRDTRQIYRLHVQGEVFVQDSNNVKASTERVVAGARLDTVARAREGNVPPKIDLLVQQGDATATTVIAGAGAEQITVAVGNARSDLVRGSGFVTFYDWQRHTDALLVPPEYSRSTWPLSAPLEDRVYVIGVAGDNQEADVVTTFIPIRVMTSSPTLPTIDVDADGMPGEGMQDADRDGLPDFLDALDHDAFALPMCYAALPVVADIACPMSPLESEDPGDGYLETDSYMVYTHPWLRLHLGATALSASSLDPATGKPTGYVPLVRLADVASYADRGSVANVSGTPPLEAHGVFDILVLDMPVQGELVSFVVPMLSPLPPRPAFVHFRPASGWSRFTSADGAQTVSLLGQPGICPDVSSPLWDEADGLVAGHHCVHVTVRDGGRNDGDAGLGTPSRGAQGDSMPNAMVAYLGGVQTVPNSVVVAGGNTGGGCVASPSRARGLDAVLASLFGLALLVLARWRSRPLRVVHLQPGHGRP